jgi:hypothetical protein
MAFKRIVANSEKDLKNILDDIKNWFENTKDYKSEFTTEKRKFLDPETKQIVEKNIDIITVIDPKGKTTIKFIPLIENGEMKIEIIGTNESGISNKLANQIKGRGALKNYTKDTKVPMKEHIMKKSELKQIIREEIKKLI